MMNCRPLFLSAFCALCMLSLPSCYTTVHKYTWNRAKIIDEAYWVQDYVNIELWRVGNTVYAKGFLGPARGGQEWNDIPVRLSFVRGGAAPCFTPVSGRSKPVYIQLSDSYTTLRANLLKYRCVQPNIYRDDAFFISWYAPRYSPHLTELPAHAVRLNERGYNIERNNLLRGYEPHTDAHKYYAYPLGVMTAVAVDMPLSLAGNALLLGFGAVSAVTVAPIVLIYDACTQPSPSEKESAPDTGGMKDSGPADPGRKATKPKN